VIKLYDISKFDGGPFLNIIIKSKEVEFTGVKFSPNGKYILLSTRENLIYVLDSFSGEKVQQFTSYLNVNKTTLEASFTPDSNFVLSGSDDGTIHSWSIQNGRETATWSKQGHGAVTCIRWNPVSCMAASSCGNALAFWILPAEDQ
jgi:COMPASS component SWD2